jgi:cystathionine beta-lyase family protein involved in aluminum resistance
MRDVWADNVLIRVGGLDVGIGGDFAGAYEWVVTPAYRVSPPIARGTASTLDAAVQAAESHLRDMARQILAEVGDA